MPRFQLEAGQVEDIMAYLKTLERYEFVAPLDGKGHIDPRNRKTRSVAAPVRGWPFFEVDQCCY